MITLFLSFLLLLQLNEVPYRAKEDFEVQLKYNFKARPSKSVDVAYEANPDKTTSGPLPYLMVDVKILNPKTEEVRFRCEDNFGRSVFNKKIGKILKYEIDMGFIDDLKDHVAAHLYTMYIVAEDKRIINKKELLVNEDGTFLVNGEKRGKF
jgi:hypothetical protein